MKLALAASLQGLDFLIWIGFRQRKGLSPRRRRVFKYDPHPNLILSPSHPFKTKRRSEAAQSARHGRLRERQRPKSDRREAGAAGHIIAATLRSQRSRLPT